MWRTVPIQNDKCRMCFFYMFLIGALLFRPVAAEPSGFFNDIPPAPYDVAYRIYFQNYPDMRPCIMTAALKLVNDTHNKSHESIAYMGCTIDNNAVVPHALILLTVDEAALASTGGCDGNTTLLEGVLRNLTLPKTLFTSGVGLVLSTRDENTTAETRCDITCFLAAVQSYNIMQRNKKRNAMPNITAVVFSDNVERYWFSGGRLSNEGLALPLEVRSAYDFVILYLSTALGDGWAKLLKTAAFNRARWSTGYEYPQCVLETRNGMVLAGPTETTQPPQTSCFQGTSPSCVPLGGWTVWASTADTKWQWDAASSAFVKKTKKGAIALMVASTTVSALHGVTPGADCPASAIVATLSVLEALKRLDKSGREVYTFFFPGEHVGSIGSARFISDATLLECASAGLSNCTALAYRDNLNFTTVNFSLIDTFIVVDQVAYNSAPLYFHVDGRVKLGAAQEKAEMVMTQSGVNRAATSTLPYSPITTLIDLIPDATIGDKVFFTLTRYNTSYVDQNVFTVFDTVGKNSTLSAASVADAADVILQVLLAANSFSTSSSSSDSSLTKVDRTVVKQLWECFTLNLRCSFLTSPVNATKNSTLRDIAIDDDVIAPDFAVGAITGEDITATQEAIEASLHRLGWTNTLRSPAVPRPLRIPNDKWDWDWQRDDAWMWQHGNGRYTLHVMSLWRENIGARGIMVGSKSADLQFLFFGILVASVVMLGTWACLK